MVGCIEVEREQEKPAIRVTMLLELEEMLMSDWVAVRPHIIQGELVARVHVHCGLEQD